MQKSAWVALRSRTDIPRLSSTAPPRCLAKTQCGGRGAFLCATATRRCASGCQLPQFSRTIKAVNSVAFYKDSGIVHPRGHLRPEATNKTSDTCRRGAHPYAKKNTVWRRRPPKSLNELLSIFPSPLRFFLKNN